MLCKHEVVGSIPSGSTIRSSMGSGNQFCFGGLSLKRVILNREEEMHPVAKATSVASASADQVGVA